MADPQDRPEGEPESKPPAKKAPAKKAAAAKPAKKAPAKKAPAKKAAAKKAPAKKAPAKKVSPPEQQPPAQQPPAQQPPAQQPADLPRLAETNGQLAAAKDAAAQAKSTVERAKNPLPAEPSEPSALQSPVPWVVAVTLSVLAMLLVRQLRRR
ncbi:nucleoid-structuring protein H-NS [Mycobacterium asiaticum]|uniref:Nucleoid-structuring protein H-NS n=1 Tax=Mycobacterium asiaticum TaxID=1790 RepID=A0A1A3P799_MYCAS|nr:nucleoid-structuring protein H-NS [Mycobacterium asiaticum]